MILCDAHTHSTEPTADKTFRIVQIDGPDTQNLPEAFSIGIHPKDIEFQELQTFSGLFLHPGLKAVGECGLDRMVRDIPLARQKEIFLRHAELAEELRKPLILHCVRCAPEMIALKKELNPGVPWIYHGFRGNERKAMDLMNAGFFLSFGSGLLRDAGNVEPYFAKLPLDRVLLETDADSPDLLPQILATAAQMSGMDMVSFSRLILGNFTAVYGYGN